MKSKKLIVAALAVVLVMCGAYFSEKVRKEREAALRIEYYKNGLYQAIHDIREVKGYTVWEVEQICGKADERVAEMKRKLVMK